MLLRGGREEHAAAQTSVEGTPLPSPGSERWCRWRGGCLTGPQCVPVHPARMPPPSPEPARPHGAKSILTMGPLSFSAGVRGGIPDCVALTCVPSTCPPVPRLSCHLCPSLPGRQNERLREGKNALQPYPPHSSRGCGKAAAPACSPGAVVSSSPGRDPSLPTPVPAATAPLGTQA